MWCVRYAFCAPFSPISASASAAASTAISIAIRRAVVSVCSARRVMRVLQALTRLFDRSAHGYVCVPGALSAVASTSRIFSASAFRLNGLAMKCTSWSSTPLCRMALRV